MMTRRRVAAALWLGLMLGGLPATAQSPLTVARIFGTAEFSGDLVSLEWMPDGRAYVVSDEANGGTSLYRVDAASGRRELLIGVTDLVRPDGRGPLAIESYSFSADGSKLLLFADAERVWRRRTKGTYYVWDLTARRLLPVSRLPGFQQFAKFSPDSRLVSFVRHNNIFVTELATGRETQLTHDGSDDIINGTSDWVYEEELDLRDAFRFSPDGTRIAFWRLDQSPIKPFYLIDETALYPELVPVRYPKAGERNSSVRIGVVTLASGDTRWVDLGPDGDVYVAEMGFVTAEELWLTRLNRHQNRLDLLLADVRTGTSRVIFTDRDSAWVEAIVPRWIDGGRFFVYESEQEGASQLFLYRRDGTRVRKLTPDPWDITTLLGVDERRGVVYFTGTGEGPLERHLYRVGVDGKGLRRLSTGSGTYGASFDPTFTYYVETHSRAGTPPTQTLRRADGQAVRPLADNAALKARVAALGLTAPEFLAVPAADGTPLNAWLIKPPGFDPSRSYPLLLYVYGGPGSQTVTDAWGGNRYLWHQLLAQEGYLVASVDNRGTGSRGRAFKKQTYLRLGQLESADQVAAARHFATLPYVDGERIGIWGWSYGGYMSSLSLFVGDGTFKAAVAVAPVTHWRLYDTIYTERYMRTPQENPEGYERGSPLTHADRLTGRLLLIHGTGDDNVHSQNTTQLIERLQNANKQFDLRLYPNKTHSISGRVTQENLYGYLTEWLRRNL